MEFDWETIMSIATSIIGTAAVIAAITPTSWDNVAVKVLRGILDVFAMNVGNAKNKDN